MSGIPGPTLPRTGIGLVDAVFRRLVDWLMLVPMQGHLNSNLADIADLTPTDGNIIVGDGTDWVAESGATARTSLGLTIGTDVQAYDAQLTDIAGLAVTDGNFIVGNGTNFVAESGATARTSLGLGTAAVETYTEGTFTPALTFATPGDLSVTYSTQLGYYTRIGRLVTATFNIVTSGFTHTTASGAASITGLPFTARTLTDGFWFGVLSPSRVSKTNYTDFSVQVASATDTIALVASGSGQTRTTINAADMPTGETIVLRGSVSYEV